MSVSSAIQITLPNTSSFSQTLTRYSVLRRMKSLCLYLRSTFLTLLTRSIKSYFSSTLHWGQPLYVYHESPRTRQPFVRAWSQIRDVPAAQRFKIPAQQHDITSRYAIYTSFSIGQLQLNCCSEDLKASYEIRFQCLLIEILIARKHSAVLCGTLSSHSDRRFRSSSTKCISRDL